jgi:hypothetical protein
MLLNLKRIREILFHFTLLFQFIIRVDTRFAIRDWSRAAGLYNEIIIIKRV